MNSLPSGKKKLLGSVRFVDVLKIMLALKVATGLRRTYVVSVQEIRTVSRIEVK